MIAPPNPSSTDSRKNVKKASGKALWGGISVAVVAAICLVVYLSLGEKKDKVSEREDKVRVKAIPETKPRQAKPAKQADDVPGPVKEDAVVVETPKPTSTATPGMPWSNKPPRVIKPRAADIKPRRFVYDSEELIANLLEIEPGTPMFGELPYGKRFNEDFKQAIMQKVKINPDDDEYTVALKKQVQAVKDDFKQILIDGGDVGEEMRKARNELKELGMFKESLKRELFELRKSGQYSSDDMKDFIAAANKMLESKGLQPLKVPRVFLRNLELKEGKIK